MNVSVRALNADEARVLTAARLVAGGVLVYEIGHLVRAHAERADALGADIDHERWNICGDLAINDDLLAAGVPLPTGAVAPAMFGLAEGGIEEVYYAALSQQAASNTTPV